MKQIIIGVILGVATSFVAGLILIWKGESLVGIFRRLPSRRRVRLFSRAYLRALHSYPYHYAHLMVLALFAATYITATAFYGFFCFILFKLDFSLPPEELRKAAQAMIDDASHFEGIVLNPWVILAVTILIIVTTIRLVFVKIPAELLVPYAHKELTRIRECVAKCATNKQFLEYTDAEHTANDLKSLKALLKLAKVILGNVDLALANEVLEGITEDLPESTPMPNQICRNLDIGKS